MKNKISDLNNTGFKNKYSFLWVTMGLLILICKRIITGGILSLSLLPVVNDTPKQREEEGGGNIEKGHSYEEGIPHSTAARIKDWKVK